MPVYLRLAGKLHLHHILPASWLKKVNFLTYYYFGVQAKNERILLKTIIEETNEKFLRWAIHQILNWKTEKRIDDFIHIHGTADNIFPVTYSDKVITIEGGGHFMIVTHAAEINEILLKLLNTTEEPH